MVIPSVFRHCVMELPSQVCVLPYPSVFLSRSALQLSTSLSARAAETCIAAAQGTQQLPPSYVTRAQSCNS